MADEEFKLSKLNYPHLQDVEEECKAAKIVIDVQTTGLNPECNEILQIGILNANTNEILMDTFVKPKAKQWPAAEKVNKITYDMVSEAPSIDQLKPKLTKIFNDTDMIIGYNISFDLDFFRNIGYDFTEKKRKDAMIMYDPDYFFRLQEAAVDSGFDWDGNNDDMVIRNCKATLQIYRSIQYRRLRNQKDLKDEDRVTVDGKNLGKFKITSVRSLANHISESYRCRRMMTKKSKTIYDVLQVAQRNYWIQDYTIEHVNKKITL